MGTRTRALLLALTIAGLQLIIGGTASAVPASCTQLIKTLTDLNPAATNPALSPDAAVAGAGHDLDLLAVEVPQVRADALESATCDVPVVKTEIARWVGLITAARTLTTDPISVSRDDGLLDALAPDDTPPSSAAVVCTRMHTLISEGKLADAQLLLDAVKSGGSDDAKKCVASAADELLAARSNSSALTVVASRWSTGYLSAILDTLAWIAGAILVGLVLSAMLRLGLRRRTQQALGLVACFIAAGILSVVVIAIIVTLRRQATTSIWMWVALGVALVAGFLVGILLSRRTRLRIDTFGAEGDDKVPNSFGREVASELGRIGRRPSRGVDVMYGADTLTPAVTDIVSALPGSAFLKAILALWTSITPSSDWKLEGAARVAESGEIRISVTLKRGRDVNSSIGISSDLFIRSGAGMPARKPSWADMVTAVSAWVYWQMADKPEEDSRLYGATRWESLALQAVAGRLFDQRQTADCENLLFTAVELDPANNACLFSLLSTRQSRINLDNLDNLPANRQLIEDLIVLFSRLNNTEYAAEADPLVWRLDYSISAALINHMVCLGRWSGHIPATERILRVPAGLSWLTWLGRPDTAPAGQFGCGRLDRLVDVRSAVRDQDAGLLTEIQSLAAPTLAILTALREKKPFAKGGEVEKLVELGPRPSFNLCCAVLVDPAGSGEFADPRGLELPVIAVEGDLTDTVKRLIARFAPEAAVAKSAATTDPFFYHLRQSHGAELNRLLGYVPEVPGDVVDSLLAFHDVLTVPGVRVRLAGRSPAEVEAELAPLTDFPGLTNAQLLRLKNAAHLAGAGLKPGQVNLLDLARLDALTVSGSTAADIATRCGTIARLLGADAPSADDARAWQLLLA